MVMLVCILFQPGFSTFEVEDLLEIDWKGCVSLSKAIRARERCLGIWKGWVRLNKVLIGWEGWVRFGKFG
jgi:hypothetical protein